MMTEDLNVTARGDVLCLAINRPRVRNALRRETYDALEQAVQTSTARCIVITGEGSAFCSGDDIQELMIPSGERAGMGPPRGKLTPAASVLAYTSTPVIAAVNGPAVGWGMELALLADVRIAGAAARFGEIFVRRGLSCDAPSLVRLTALVGRDWAARLLFTGDIIDAQAALRIGLVSEVTTDEDLLPAALDLASRIAASPPLAVRRMKEGLRKATEPDWEAVGRWVGASYDELFATEDHHEAVSAYLAKREVHFKGC